MNPTWAITINWCTPVLAALEQGYATIADQQQNWIVNFTDIRSSRWGELSSSGRPAPTFL
jgi:hypothetical protein